MLVTLLDVTERERIEEELRKAQRLESLGLVAGGIAHDFNNLLTAVFGQVELARGHLEAGSPAAPELDVALSALARSRDLTRQLLTFATGGAPARKILSVPQAPRGRGPAGAGRVVAPGALRAGARPAAGRGRRGADEPAPGTTCS